MGKRELILVAVFAILGVIAYQASAPDSPAASWSGSIDGPIDHLRRAVRGHRGSAEVRSTHRHPVDPTITDVRLQLRRATLVLEGEDRTDVAIEMLVWSNGYDDTEAQSLAKQTILKFDASGTTLIAHLSFPDPGSQQATLKMKVPARLRVRMENSGPATIGNVAAVEVVDGRENTVISGVPGAVSGTHRGGDLALDQVGSARITAQNSDVRITRVRDLLLNVRGGNVRVQRVTGSVEIESQGADVALEELAAVAGLFRVNASGGSVAVKDLHTDARIDGRQTDIHVAMDRPAPLAIYNEGEAEIVLTPPLGGYTLDALARGGQITPPELLQRLGLKHTVAEGADEARASGAVGGGGPTITLRAARGSIALEERKPAQIR